MVVLSIAGGLLAATAGTVAYASIPSADGTITACVTPATGTVRIIDADSTQTCLLAEKKVVWGSGLHPRGTFQWSEVYKAGDVVYIGTDYFDGTGRCPASPGPGQKVQAGSWVRLTAPTMIYMYGTSYAEDSPCVSNPNWSLLAKDGAAGAAGATGPQGPAGPTGPQGPPGFSNAHWAVISPTGTVTASSDAKTSVAVSRWNVGSVFVSFGSVPDISKCGVTVTAGQDPTQYGQKPLFASFMRYYNYVLVETNAPNGTFTDAEMNISVNCPSA